MRVKLHQILLYSKMPDLFSFRSILIAFGIVFLKDVGVCQPLLTGPMSPICQEQNESVTFTCTDTQVAILKWKVANDPVDRFFTTDDKEGKVRMVGDNFTAVLVDISNKSRISSTGEPVADLTSTLTASTMAITNGTIIICETVYSPQNQTNRKTSSITLILAEEPVPTATVVEAGSNVLQKNLMQFLATLFDGSYIDYYNISFSGSDEVILNTSGGLPHLPWLHNITSFNVTAHNCAGQSAPVVVYIFHNINDNGSAMDGIAIGIIRVMVGTAAVFFTVVMVASICIYICVQSSKRKCHKPIHTNENTRPKPGEDARLDVQTESTSSVPPNHMPQSGIDLTNNPAYEVCQQRTHLSDMKYLSAQKMEFNMDNNPLYIVVNAQK